MAGSVLVELLIAFTAMLLMIPTVMGWMSLTSEEGKIKASAEHIESFADGAKAYVKSNYDLFKATASATNCLTAGGIYVATLRAAGALPPTFSDKNAWGQPIVGCVLQPSPGVLDIISYSVQGKTPQSSGAESDRSFGTVAVPKAATMVGARGGYVPTGTVAGESTSVLRGAYGAWTYDTTGISWPSGLVPAAGHLVVYERLTAQAVASEYLHRVAVPGRQDLNTMATDLYLGGYDMNLQNGTMIVGSAGKIQLQNGTLEVGSQGKIDMQGGNLTMGGGTIQMGRGDVGGGDNQGIKTLNFEKDWTVATVDPTGFCAAGDDKEGRVFLDNTNGLWVCRNGSARLIYDGGNNLNIRSIDMVDPNYVLANFTCPVGSPHVYTSPVLIAQGASASEIAGIWTGATGAGPWTIKLEIYVDIGGGTYGWVTPPSGFGKILLISTCS